MILTLWAVPTPCISSKTESSNGFEVLLIYVSVENVYSIILVRDRHLGLFKGLPVRCCIKYMPVVLISHHC